jgi:RNA polymerase sigma-70 factor (sigma-E family)
MEESEAFLRREHASLTRAAYLLTGDVVAAQDLAQDAALRVLSAWPRVAAADSPSAYARKILVNAFLRDRRRFWRREVPHAAPPEVVQSSAAEDVDTREVLRRALLSLTPRQRAAVVLRYLEDRSEADTAALLGVTPGTVKTLTSRGLAGLRGHLGDRAYAHGYGRNGGGDG